jgi:hypothetical protein
LEVKVVLHHQSPPGAAEAERELRANDAGGYPATRAAGEDQGFERAGLRAEHVAFSFMKRRVQPLMARDTLGYQYTGDDDTSQMPGGEVVDDDIVDRLGRIFKDMPAYTSSPCPRTPPRVHPMRLVVVLKSSTDYVVVVMLIQCASCRMT